MNDEVRHLTERRAELEELELVSMLEQEPSTPSWPRCARGSSRWRRRP